MGADIETAKKMDLLLRSMEKIYPSLGRLMIRSFVQGVFFALGTTVGISIVFAILTFFIHQLKTIPIIKQIIIETQVEKVLPERQK